MRFFYKSFVIFKKKISKGYAIFSTPVSTAEDYLKSVILEARQQPDIVRASIPSRSKISQNSENSELTFKQLSTSSIISKSNFDKKYKIDEKYLPTEAWKNDRIEIFKHARRQVGNHAGKLKGIDLKN